MSHPEKPSSPLPVQRMATNGHAHNAGALMIPQNSALQLSGGEPKPAGPPALTAPPSASSLWCAFRRRWLLAVSAGLVAGLLTLLAVMTLVPGRYTADALIIVNPPAASAELNESYMDLKTFRDNQQAIIKSSPVLNAALNKPEVQALPAVQGQVDAIGWLRSQIKIDFNEGPSILRLSSSGGNPEELKVVINAVATAFVHEVQQSERAKSKVELDNLKKTLQDLQVSVQTKEQELAKKLVFFNFQDPRQVEKQLESLRKNLDTINDSMLKADLEEGRLKATLKALAEQKKDVPNLVIPAYAVDEILKDDDVFKKTRQEIGFLQHAIPLLKNKYQEPLASQYAAQFRNQIAAMEKQLKEYRENNEDKVRGKYLEKIETEVMLNSSQLAGVKEQKETLKIAFKEMSSDIKKIETRTTPKEIGNLDSAIKSEKVAFDKLQDRYAVMQAKSAANNVTILQLAEVPQLLDRSRQYKMAGGAGLAMFLFMLLGVALIEFRTRKINSADDVTQGLNLALVGSVPNLPARIRKPSTQAPSSGDLYWHSLLTEAIDSIRTMLLYTARADGLQVVMITSAMGGEGKTSLASQLAASLARAWKKTLLIDGDLRNPAAHKLFGQSLEPGFSDVLRGEVNVADAVHPTALSRLWLMPAGNWDNHAVQALAQDGLKNMFDQLKEQYDFIIVDSCPILPVADSLLLGQHVDTVIFSILRDVSRAGAVYAAQQRLERLGIRPMGAVMLGAEVPTGAYPYALRSGS